MKIKNKLLLVSIVIVLLPMTTATSSIESLPNVNESNQFVNNTEIKAVKIAAFSALSSGILSNFIDVERPQQAITERISEDKLCELDKEEELNPKEPYVLALWGGEYKPAPTEKLDPKLENRMEGFETKVKGIDESETYCYIMISGRILISKIKELEEHGVEVVGWYPSHCIAAKVKLNRIANIKNLSFVKWIGYGNPMIKLDPVLQDAIRSENISNDKQREITISMFEEDAMVKKIEEEMGGKRVIKYTGAGKFRDTLEQNGVKILAYDRSLKMYHAQASLGTIQKIAYMDFVAGIETKPSVWKMVLDESAPVIGADYIRGTSVYYDGSGVSVGIIDSGYEVDHQDLPPVSYCVDYVEDDCYNDTIGHGTHVAGILLGRGNVHKHYMGVAPGVSDIQIAKVVYPNGTITNASVLNAMDWMAQSPPPDIVSMSLGAIWANPRVMKTLYVRVSSTSQNLAIFVPFLSPHPQ